MPDGLYFAATNTLQSWKNKIFPLALSSYLIAIGVCNVYPLSPPLFRIQPTMQD